MDALRVDQYFLYGGLLLIVGVIGLQSKLLGVQRQTTALASLIYCTIVRLAALCPRSTLAYPG